MIPCACAAERILGLCKSIFRVDSVLLHLLDGDTVFVRPGDAAFPEDLRRRACALLAPADGAPAACIDPNGDTRQVFPQPACKLGFKCPRNAAQDPRMRESLAIGCFEYIS